MLLYPPFYGHRFLGTRTRVSGLVDAGFFLGLDEGDCQYESKIKWVAETQNTFGKLNSKRCQICGTEMPCMAWFVGGKSPPYHRD